MVFYILDFFGIGTLYFLHWLLALSIGILLLDVFLNTEIFSYIGVFFFASYFTGISELFLPIQWGIAAFVVFFLLGIFLYYTMWKHIVSPVIYNLFMRNAVKEPIETAKNQIGVYRNINGVIFVEWNGELWNGKSIDNEHYSDRENVTITHIDSSGIALLKKIKKGK